VETLRRKVRTPRTITITIAAGAYYDWDVEGAEFRVLSLSGVTTVQFAFNNDSFQTAYPSVGYPVAAGLQFERVRLYNSAGTSATVVAVASDAPVGSELADVSDLLESIRDGIIGPTTAGAFAQTTVGVAAVQIFASAAGTVGGIIQADPANTGTIYLGFDNTVASNKCFAALAATEAWTFDDYRGDVYAIASVAAQLVNEGLW
jgi:hypothetical protein